MSADDRAAADRRAVVLAGFSGDISTARQGLGHANPTVRVAALGALARSDALSRTEVQVAIGDPSAAVRRRAVEATVGINDWESPSRLLDDPDHSVVEVAAWALGELGPHSVGALDELTAVALGHDDSLCREAAVAALGAIGDQRALPTIFAALDDKATVRRRAVIALAPFEGEEVDAALTRSLEDRDAQVRQVAEDLLDPNR